MEITYPSNLLTSVKNKHLLLDANVFRDAVTQPKLYTSFFNDLKKANIVLGTIDLVKFELLTGSANAIKYEERKQHIEDIIDVVIPVTSTTCTLAYSLIQEYGIDGSGVSNTDLFLGALLKQYRDGIYLLTRDTSDFIKRIFNLLFIVNCPYSKGIFTYGIYQYK